MFDVSNEVCLILATGFLGTSNYKTFIKKNLFVVCPKALTRTKKRRKKRMAIAKLFVLHANAINGSF